MLCVLRARRTGCNNRQAVAPASGNANDHVDWLFSCSLAVLSSETRTMVVGVAQGALRYLTLSNDILASTSLSARSVPLATTDSVPSPKLTGQQQQSP